MRWPFSNRRREPDWTALAKIGPRTDIRGRIDRRVAGASIVIGADCLIEGTLVTEVAESRIQIGDNVYVGGGTTLDCVLGITVGDDVLISYQCLIADSDNHSVRYSIRKRDCADWKRDGSHDWSTTRSAAVSIGRGAWIGARSIILKGVTIGEGAVIGAGSVVTRDVPPWSIAAGNPARVVRELGPGER